MQFLIDITLTLFYLLGFLLLCTWSWRFWKMHVNQKFLNKFGHDCILLEIKLPREIFKSPYAMEVALSFLAQGGGVGTWYNRNIEGNLVGYFSLEIASLEGIVHFYVRTHKKFQGLVESNLYAQYPGIEITVADDYTSLIKYDHRSTDVDLWGAEYPLSKKWTPKNAQGKPYKKDGEDYKMPADFLPIKTYVDYELDKDPKEEFKTDPLVPLLEFLGSLGKGEYAWYQILVQDASKFNDEIFHKTYVNEMTHDHMTIGEMASERKKQIRTGKITLKGDLQYDDLGGVKQISTGKKDEDGNPILMDAVYKADKIDSKKDTDLTIEEKDEIELINRKMSKTNLRAVVRLMYIAKNGSGLGNGIQNILSIMRHFGSTNGAGNSFGLSPVDPYSFSWQNTFGKRTPWRKEEMFEAFVEREAFYPHIPKREGLDKNEDLFFFNSSMEARKIWRMFYESIFYPFDHPHAEVTTLNVEELATLWHFPGAVASTPKIPRIDSTKGVAPLNLPQ
jgi:hypothetical protein